MGNGLPRCLGLFQDAFLVWVILGAVWGYFWPESAVAGGSWIPQALGAIMLGMGLTLTRNDVHSLRSAGRPLFLGIVLQYLIMPLGAWLLASVLRLPKLLAVGVILVGASPGGTASNVITLLAKGDVALSVAMTTASTLLSPLLTPLWVWLLASAWLSVDPIPLFWAVVQIVLVPVVIGITVRQFWTPPRWFIEGLLPLVSIAIIAWIVGVVVGLNHDVMGSSDLVCVMPVPRSTSPEGLATPIHELIIQRPLRCFFRLRKLLKNSLENSYSFMYHSLS